MRAFSRSRGLILKTFLYQIVMSFFGVMMTTATSSNKALFVIGQLLVVLFYFYILFSQMSQQAYKNSEYDCAHQEKSSVLLGFLIALIAFLPAILLSAASRIWLPYFPDGQNHCVVPFLLNKTFLQGMYIGIVQTVFPTASEGASAVVSAANASALNNQTFLFLFSSIPGILISGIGYVFGYFRFSSGNKGKNKE